MSRKHLFWILPCLAGLLFVVALYVPNTLPVNSDFGAIYYTDLALVNGIHIYDLSSVGTFVAGQLGISPDKFFLPRFPYPPWYALSTFYLGLLPIKAAAMLWFELNLAMLFLSIHLLADEWPPRLRLFSFLFGLCFLPVLGTLSVGQYDFPVLLGVALSIYALRKENLLYLTIATVLLTFKPHVGGVVLLAVLLHLFLRRDEFGKQALRWILVASGGLFIIGFLADPGWPLNYPAMLLGYQTQSNVSSCSECANWPIWFSRWWFDGSFVYAVRIAVVLLALLVLWFFSVRTVLTKSAVLLVVSALLITLLASPYLYNYDFLLLLVPLGLFFNKEAKFYVKIFLFFCYIIPTIMIAWFGRAGNISLLVIAMLLALLHYSRMHELSKVEDGAQLH